MSFLSLQMDKFSYIFTFFCFLSIIWSVFLFFQFFFIIIVAIYLPLLSNKFQLYDYDMYLQRENIKKTDPLTDWMIMYVFLWERKKNTLIHPLMTFLVCSKLKIYLWLWWKNVHKSFLLLLLIFSVIFLPSTYATWIWQRNNYMKTI